MPHHASVPSNLKGALHSTNDAVVIVKYMNPGKFKNLHNNLMKPRHLLVMLVATGRLESKQIHHE